ncbi:MAG: putative DNA binding domain-containing protein, partial [Proteobacteria bacterium]|nr:putative DNA binding domain-containing protein [Pseudomonadota bacterium]
MSDLPTRETLTVEFKSDLKRLSDDDLIEAVVGMANGEGGIIYLGIEKDGVPSGLHPAHSDLDGLASMLANRIQPSIIVSVTSVIGGGKTVAAISVPKSGGAIYSTQRARTLRRRLRFDGEPECVPFHPHEFPSRLGELGAFDWSAQPCNDLNLDALDPLERARLRRAIEGFNGDKSLLKLTDDELDGALGLIESINGRPVPTTTGLLLIGKEQFIKSHVATHEVAFQVLDNLQVRVNEFYRWPLIRLFEQLEQHFRAWYKEEEVQVGLFRVPVPNVDRTVFREAIVNALVHRDYARLGAIHVQWNDSKNLSISSPGGLVSGVTVQTLLTVSPKPRNPRLADAFKRIGLAERTGRGVDAIYRGVLRYGRPAPSYARTTADAVVVDLNTDKADLEFLRLVLEQENDTGQSLPLPTLQLLSTLRHHRRVDAAELAQAMGDITVHDVKSL